MSKYYFWDQYLRVTDNWTRSHSLVQIGKKYTLKYHLNILQNKEKERKEAEKQRKISEQQQFESERLAREEKDTKRREQGRNSRQL